MLKNEKRIIRKVKQSNADAFRELFDYYYPKIFSFLKAFVRNSNDAENLVQDVFFTLWESRSELNEHLSFSSFLYKIAKNKALNHIRKEVNSRFYTEYCKQNMNEEDSSTEKAIESRDMIELIRKQIQMIPERRREIFLCSFNEGLSYKEIAEKLNISENTVDSQIRNALNYLKNTTKENI